MARKHNIIIVGSGLFGSIAATLARSAGHTVTVVDGRHAWGASKASGCVLAPSWLSSLSREQIDTAMGVLGDLYPVHDMIFQTNLLKTFKAKRVAAADILVEPDVVGEVTEVRDGVVLIGKQALRGKVLVAAGIGSAALIKEMPAMRGLWGASAVFAGDFLPEPRIHVYAPYRQAVAFNLTKKSVWMGDGTALIEKTWEKEAGARAEATVERGADLFGLRGKAKVSAGARPVVDGHKAGYFARVSSSTWVSTGGAKNGTVLAAWQADQFLKELP